MHLRQFAADEHGAVRIEDLVVVTPTGCRDLTKFPKGVTDFEIE